MTTYTLSIVVEGRDAASGPLGRVSSALGNMGQIVGGILGANIIMQLGTQLIAFGQSSLQATADIQMLKVGLESLVARELRSADSTLTMTQALQQASPAAADLLSKIKTLAIQSPYRLGTIQDTFRLAMAFGFASDEALHFTNAVLTMSAGIGASDDMMNRMAYNLAQIRLQGKVTAVDVRQLAMAGFDLVGALTAIGAAHGIAITSIEDFNKAIADGKLKWEDFATDFEKYADNQFGGAAVRLSRTLQGLKSTFQDFFVLTMPTILGPAAEKVTALLQRILDKFIEFSNSGVLEQWGQSMADAFSPFIDPMMRFMDAWDRLGLTVNGDDSAVGRQGITNLERFRGALNYAFGPEAGQILDGFIMEWGKLMNGDFSGLVEDMLKAFQSIDWNQIISSMISAIKQVDWGTIAKTIEKEIEETAQVIGDFVSSIDWVQVGEDIKTHIREIDWNGIGALMAEMWTFVMDLAGISEVVTEKTSNNVANGLRNIDWGGIMYEIGYAYWSIIAGAYGMPTDEALAKMNEGATQLGITIAMAWQKINLIIAGKVTDISMTVAGLWENMKTIIAAKMTEIKNNITSKWTEIKGSVSTLIAGMAASVAGGVTVLVGGFTTLINAVIEYIRSRNGEFWSRAQGWLIQMRQAIVGSIGIVVSAIQMLIAAALAAIVPIVIPVSWGSPGPMPGYGGGGGGGGTGGAGGGTCFLRGTPIRMANGGLQAIETVQAGDLIMSRDMESGESIVTEVTETLIHGSHEIKGYYILNGLVRVTGDHLLLVDGDWKAVNQLHVGDLVTGWNDEDICIEKIETVVLPAPSYNLHTNHESHNYFAYGMVAHNYTKGARGLDNFIVPPGFNNDNFPIFASSGETVTINQPRTYRGGSQDAGQQAVNVSINIANVSSDIDVERMAYEVARRIQEHS